MYHCHDHRRHSSPRRKIFCVATCYISRTLSEVANDQSYQCHFAALCDWSTAHKSSDEAYHATGRVRRVVLNKNAQYATWTEEGALCMLYVQRVTHFGSCRSASFHCLLFQFCSQPLFQAASAADWVGGGLRPANRSGLDQSIWVGSGYMEHRRLKAGRHSGRVESGLKAFESGRVGFMKTSGFSSNYPRVLLNFRNAAKTVFCVKSNAHKKHPNERLKRLEESIG